MSLIGHNTLIVQPSPEDRFIISATGDKLNNPAAVKKCRDSGYETRSIQYETNKPNHPITVKPEKRSLRSIAAAAAIGISKHKTSQETKGARTKKKGFFHLPKVSKSSSTATNSSPLGEESGSEETDDETLPHKKPSMLKRWFGRATKPPRPAKKQVLVDGEWIDPDDPKLTRTLRYLNKCAVEYMAPKAGDVPGITLGDAMHPGATFHYKVKWKNDFDVRPITKEIVHLRDPTGAQYLIVEEAQNNHYITSGLLPIITAEISSPLFTDRHTFSTDFLVYATSSAIGSVQLMQSMMNHFCAEQTTSKQKRGLLEAIKRWIHSQPEEFTEDVQMACIFRAFMKVVEKDLEFRKFCAYLKSTFTEKKYKVVDWEKHVRDNDPRFIDHEMITKQYYQFFRAPPNIPLIDKTLVHDTAQYLAALHLQMFRDAFPLRTIKAWWNENQNDQVYVVDNNQWRFSEKKSCLKTSDRVARMLRRTKMLIHWVQNEALVHVDIVKRAQAIQNLIDIAGFLFKFKDFHGTMCIMMGLTTPGVTSLTRTWERVSTAHLDIYKRLQEDLCLKSNLSTYPISQGRYKAILKAALHSKSGPVIPFFDSFLNEIVTYLSSQAHSHRTAAALQKRKGTHKDYSIDYFGSFDTTSNAIPTHCPLASLIGIPPLGTHGLIDLHKQQSLIRYHSSYAEAVGQSYPFSRHLTQNSFGLRMNVPGPWNDEYIGPLKMIELEDGPEKTGFDYLSEMVERRVLTAWGMRYDVRVNLETCRSEDAYRLHSLSIMHRWVMESEEEAIKNEAD